METTGQPRRDRHLMDPNAPRKKASSEDLERLARVQRRVMTALVVTTVLHLSVGLVIAAAAVETDDPIPKIGLCVLGSIFGVIAIASGFAIQRKSLLTPWLLLGVFPGVIGLFFVL